MNSGTQTHNISEQAHPASISIQPGFASLDKANSSSQAGSKAYCFHHLPCFCSSAKATHTFSDFTLFTYFLWFLSKNVTLQMKQRGLKDSWDFFERHLYDFILRGYLLAILICKTKEIPERKQNKPRSVRPSLPMSICWHVWVIGFEWCLLGYHIPDLMESGIYMW